MLEGGSRRRGEGGRKGRSHKRKEGDGGGGWRREVEEGGVGRRRGGGRRREEEERGGGRRTREGRQKKDLTSHQAELIVKQDYTTEGTCPKIVLAVAIGDKVTAIARSDDGEWIGVRHGEIHGWLPRKIFSCLP
jgi:hypothetical protein